MKRNITEYMQADGKRRASVSKHTALFRLQRDKIFSVFQLMGCLFYYDDVDKQSKAEKLILRIRDKPYYSADWEAVRDELQISTNQYYSMLNKFRSAGMVRKHKGLFVIDNDFASRIVAAKDIWEWKIWGEHKIE